MVFVTGLDVQWFVRSVGFLSDYQISSCPSRSGGGRRMSGGRIDDGSRDVEAMMKAAGESLYF